MPQNWEIQQAISNGKTAKARKLLRDALAENPDAETYYLASLVALNDTQRIYFLTKALNIDPWHTQAADSMSQLMGRHPAPSSTENTPAPLLKGKELPIRSSMLAKVLFISAVIVILGLGLSALGANFLGKNNHQNLSTSVPPTENIIVKITAAIKPTSPPPDIPAATATPFENTVIPTSTNVPIPPTDTAPPPTTTQPPPTSTPIPPTDTPIPPTPTKVFGQLTGKIAFTCNAVPNQDNTNEICILNLATGDSTRVTNNDVPDWDPHWSSDGQQIAFTSFRSGNYDIWVMNADGSNPRNLIDLPAWDDYPAWSPLTSQFAFASTGITDGVANSEIFIRTSAGDIRRITFNTGRDEWPSWSPDEQWIANSSDKDGDMDIYLTAVNGNTSQAWTQDSVYDEQPSWSPDGQWIVFLRKDQDTNGNGSLNRRDDGDYGNIWVGSRDGTDFRQLTFDNQAADPAWSPDGNYIVFAHFWDSNDDGKLGTDDPSTLQVVPVGGGEPIILTNGTEQDWAPDWMP